MWFDFLTDLHSSDHWAKISFNEIILNGEITLFIEGVGEASHDELNIQPRFGKQF